MTILLNEQQDLTQGSIARKLLLFALPILAGNIAQALNGSINVMWIGHFLGEAALTAAVNANNIQILLIGSIFGLSMATNIMIAQSFGAKNIDHARKVMGTSVIFFISLSIIIAAIGWFMSQPLLVAIDIPPESLDQGVAYLKVTFLSMPILFFFIFLVAAMRGIGDSHTPFLFLILAALLDVAFNPILIFGLGPFPKMGISGSAWGSLLGQLFALSALLFYMRRSHNPLWIDLAHRKYFRISFPILRTTIMKGVPMGLQMMLVSLSMITMMTMINHYGSTTAAAYSASMQIWAYVQMPAIAIGAACSSFAAQNIGAQRWDRISKITYYGVGFSIFLTGTLSLLILFLDKWALAAFLPSGSEAWGIARHLNAIVIWSFVLFGVNFVISGTVRATGAVIPPLLILGFSLWGIRMPFAMLLQPYIGVEAIWWSFPISSGCCVMMSVIYYRFGRWRQAKILPFE